MHGDLEISLRPKKNRNEHVIDFFFAKKWDAGTEQHLIYRLQEILCLTRNYSEKLSLTLVIQAKDPERVKMLLKKYLSAKNPEMSGKLSIRELEVLDLLMQGLTNKEIASKLFISYETVKTHRKHILQKTLSKNTAALMGYYHNTFFEKL